MSPRAGPFPTNTRHSQVARDLYVPGSPAPILRPLFEIHSSNGVSNSELVRMSNSTIKQISRLFNTLSSRDSVNTKDIGHQLYQYRAKDGSFDFKRYEQTQISGNKRKIDKVWVSEGNVAYLANYIESKLIDLDFGLCHGTRRGKEQEWFRKYLRCQVLGTEISPTAEEFPHTIRWDFHNVKPEWINSVDFIYSNSLDHSYDPRACLTKWMSCLKPRGLCIIEHTSGHEEATELDPFGAPIELMPFLILTWGEGRFFVKEILEAPVVDDKLEYVRFLVIERC